MLSPCISEPYTTLGDPRRKLNFADILEVTLGAFTNTNKLACEDQQPLASSFCIYNSFTEHRLTEIHFIDCHLSGLEGKRREACILCHYWLFNWE